MPTPSYVVFLEVLPAYAATATPSPAPLGSSVIIGSATFPVEIAATQRQQADGLSRRDAMPAGTGMLFPFATANYYGFWMKDMRFPLDLLWIGTDCLVSEMTANVPPPPLGTPDTALLSYRSQRPVRFVLELNAGEAASQGVAAGTAVTFRGDALKDAGCPQVRPMP